MFAETIDDRKIGVLSDTHGSCLAWRRALVLFGPEVRTVLHAGDVLYHGPRNAIPGGYTPADLAEEINRFGKEGGRVFIAQGNCDAAVDAMVLDPQMTNHVALVWRGRKVLMMHGDNFPLLRAVALKNDVDVAISGHTHVGSLVREKKTIFLNPGSTTIPKGRDPESAAIMTDEGIRIMTLDGEELHFEKW
ncbi:phosphodiesterase [Synergistes jonesii]|uniref:phosphodiesterase n=1 Tax=Synergistes jonesii TaxID=2754 RepID=UPI002430B70E|nr:phosphodiesterase [Synergistes jonesii]